MPFVKGFVAVICMWALQINPASCQQSNPLETIQVWSYYESLPFQTSETGEGLSQDFVDLLNRQNEFQFKLEIIPRVRLDYYLSQKYKGLVLFVNWQWMGKEAKQGYLWSAPLLHDRNEVVSSVKNPVQYSGPNSLVGKSFAAIRGRKYTGLEKLLEQDKIHRQFVNNEGSALLLINSGRVQTTSMARILFLPHIQKLKLQGKVFVSDTPLFAFTRHIMTSRSLPKVHDFIQGMVKGLDQNPQWQAILEKYDLHEK